MPKIALFSYGSNSLDQLKERLGRKPKGTAAWLPGYRRVYRGYSRRWGGGVASLKPQHGRITYGYLSHLDPDEIAILDEYEGVASGNYKHVFVSVRTDADDGPIEALAYVSTSREENNPTRAYLEAVAKTVGTFWFDDTGKRPTWKDFK